MSLKDDSEEIRLYNIPNPHVQGMIIGQIVKPNILYVTDLISPRGPIQRDPGTVAVGDALRKYGITGADHCGRSRHNGEAVGHLAGARPELTRVAMPRNGTGN